MTRADLLVENALVTWDHSDDPEQLQYGQLLPEEGRVLRHAARTVPAGQVIVEVGSYTGKSTCCLLRGSAEGTRVPVYAVDLWTAGTSHKGRYFRARLDGEQAANSKFHTPEVLAVFRRRMEVYGNGLVRERMGASVTVAASFDESIGLLFIDAEHTYEACRADFEAWSPRVTANGVIALHDYKVEGDGGVRRYIDEVLANGRWRRDKIVGSLVLLRSAG